MSGTGIPIITQCKNTSCFHLPRWTGSNSSWKHDQQYKDDMKSTPEERATSSQLHHELDSEGVTIPEIKNFLQPIFQNQSTGDCKSTVTAMTVDPQKRWTVTINVYYYDHIQQISTSSQSSSPDKYFTTKTITKTTFAELHISFSPIDESFGTLVEKSSAKCQIALFASTEVSEGEIDDVQTENDNTSVPCNENYSQKYSLSPISPDVVFSSDGRYIACLVPSLTRLPSQKEESDIDEISSDNRDSKSQARSHLVIFTIEKRHNESKQCVIPLPNYIKSSHPEASNLTSNSIDQNNTLILPIPASPQKLSINSSTAIKEDLTQTTALLINQISCICNVIPTSVHDHKTGSLLLAGCNDGSILIIGYRRASLIGILYHADENHSSHETTSSDESGIVQMTYHPPSEHYADSCGRMVLIQRDGKALLFSTQFTYTSNQQVELDNDQFNYSWRHDSGLLMRMIPSPVNHFHTDDSKQIGRLPYLRAIFLDFSFVALLTNPWFKLNSSYSRSESVSTDYEDHDTIAQVWFINNHASHVKCVAQLDITESTLLERKHGIFQIETKHNQDRSTIHPCNDYIAWYGMGCSITADINTKSIALSSAIVSKLQSNESNISLKPFITIWHWKDSVSGFTLVNENDFAIQKSSLVCDGCYSSYPIFHRDDSNRCYFIHYHSGGYRFWRDTYNVGILCPPEVLTSKSCCKVEKFNPILITNKSIIFPDILKPSVNKDLSMTWREEKVPSSYVSSNGPITIASIGSKYGNVIALAASKGLCILDLCRNKEEKIDAFFRNKKTIIPTSCIEGYLCNSNVNIGCKNLQLKWRMFKEYVERSFTVHAMTWWERGEHSDDLLIAVIEYLHEHNDGCLYLVCWSRRWLDMGNYQLLEDLDSKYDKAIGVKLPSGFKPHHLSILPEQGQHTTKMDNNRGNRAVIFLGTQTKESSVDYLFFRVQTYEPKDLYDNETVTKQNMLHVLAKKISAGVIAPESIQANRIDDQIATFSYFISGASFCFDLRKNNGNSCQGQEYFATICMINDVTGSLFVLAIGSRGIFNHTFVTKYVEDTCSNCYKNRWKFWIGDVKPPTKSRNIPHNRGFISWTLSSNERELVWEVPFFIPSNEICDPILVSDTECTAPLTFLSLSTNNTSLHHNKCSNQITNYLGKFYEHGDDIQIFFKDNDVIRLGPSLFDKYSCILQVEQGCKSVRSGASRTQLFFISDFIIGPPPITTSMFVNIYDNILSSDEWNHINDIIQSHKYCDSLTAIIRMILCGIIELIFSVKQNITRAEQQTFSDQETYEEFLKFLLSILSKLVTVSIENTSLVQFSSLFLQTGRQLEPHHFDHLFPLKIQDSINSICDGNLGGEYGDVLNSKRVLSVQDLVNIGIFSGSLFVAVAALPLLPEKKMSHQKCIELLHHCISSILSFTEIEGSFNLMCMREECLFLSQVYQYGLKLEASMLCDAEEAETDVALFTFNREESRESLLQSEDHQFSDSSGNNDFSVVQDSEYDSTESSSSTTPKLTQVEESSGRLSSFASLLTSPFTRRRKENVAYKDIEAEINDAAINFILKGYDDHLDEILSESGDDGYYDDGISTELEYEELMSPPRMLNLPQKVGESFNSVSTLVVRAIVSNMIHCLYGRFSWRNRLSKIANICLLLQVEVQPLSTDSNVIEARNIVDGITANDIYDAMKIVGDIEGPEINFESLDFHLIDHSTAKIFRNLMYLCSRLWDKRVTMGIFDVTTHLLAQKCIMEEARVVVTLLSFLASVSSNMLGEKLFSDTRNIFIETVEMLSL